MGEQLPRGSCPEGNFMGGSFPGGLFGGGNFPESKNPRVNSPGGRGVHGDKLSGRQLSRGETSTTYVQVYFSDYTSLSSSSSEVLPSLLHLSLNSSDLLVLPSSNCCSFSSDEIITHVTLGETRRATNHFLKVVSQSISRLQSQEFLLYCSLSMHSCFLL